LFYFNDESESLRIALHLSQPFRLEVFVDGERLPESEFDRSQKPGAGGSRLPELGDPHGSYAFDPHARRFYFTLRGGIHSGRPATLGGGSVLLRLMMVVQLSLTVSVPLREFDGKSMVDNIATLLQIDKSRIKIVSVQSRAQVAGASGRRLDDNGEASSASEVIFHIVEANPEPLPGEAFDGAGPGYVENQTGAGTDGDANAMEGNGTNESIAATSSFSMEALGELEEIVAAIQVLAKEGVLAERLNTTVVLDEVVTTDPASWPMTTTRTFTTRHTTTTTMGTLMAMPTTTNMLAPNSDGDAKQDDDSIGVAEIVVGTLVGALVGGLLMAAAIYYKLKVLGKAGKVMDEYYIEP